MVIVFLERSVRSKGEGDLAGEREGDVQLAKTHWRMLAAVLS